MGTITKVRIKNFRSIVDETFYPKDLTIIVGPNDSGKSNFLRALNLFFNNETDIGHPFDFTTDFSNKAVVGRGKAHQIEVMLEIQPPAGFANRKLVRWERIWRSGDLTSSNENIEYIDGSKISGRSKTETWLNRIRFRYVPAIKGREYFTRLLRDLHDILAETVDAEIRAASTDFIKIIRGHTSQISSVIQEELKLDSRLQLPASLRSLFEVLDFETSSGSAAISLQQRGDGIKVRHISAILKFIADQERKLAAKGRPRPSTIWGYEEPENNLEMSRCFEHANELLKYSQSIQILATTHSPAFYSLLGNVNSNVIGYTASLDSSQITYLTNLHYENIQHVDQAMGLMPLVAPYIAKKAAQLEEARNAVAEFQEKLAQKAKPIVLVAGKTDAIYIKHATSIFASKLLKKVDIEFLGKDTDAGSVGSGDPALIKLVHTIIDKPSLLERPVLAIFDCDVKSIPSSDNDKLIVRQLVMNPENKVAKKGIENLLPESVFIEDYYSETIKISDYGEKKIIQTLDKLGLCEALCVSDEVQGMTQEEIFAQFHDVVSWINDLI